jgi:hypothetical protein
MKARIGDPCYPPLAYSAVNVHVANLADLIGGMELE